MLAAPNNADTDPGSSLLVDSRTIGEPLSFVWWNTNLAPPGGRVATSDQQNVAAQLVRKLIADVRVDFIALGEVSQNEREDFRQLAAAEGFSLLDGFGASGRSRFDMLFLYNTSRLIVGEPRSIEAAKGNRTLRVAQRIDILVSGTKRPVHLLVSHWPSRLMMPKDSPDRSLLGLRLRDAVSGLFEDHTDAPNPNVILLGDYNDEPFDNSLTEGLLSTRDRNLAKRRRHLLYNPFWRYLGAPCGSAESKAWNLGGTYYHQGGDVTRWRLFDQMIFSRAFLGGGEWMLDESLTQFIDIPNYSRLLDNTKEHFDHAPILGVVRRVESD